jgi:hypothetical protein
MRTDIDQISALAARGAKNLLGRNAVAELSLYPDTGLLRLGDERGQLPLGLAPHAAGRGAPGPASPSRAPWQTQAVTPWKNLLRGEYGEPVS